MTAHRSFARVLISFGTVCGFAAALVDGDFPARAADVSGGDTAVLGGGCFWGMEEFFRKIPGVVATRVGYAGGKAERPTYEQVSQGATGHAEVLEVRFDPKRVTYEDLLKLFFRMHDPTTRDRQGNDVGTQYRSAIFTQGEAQRKIADRVKSLVEASGKWKKPLTTEIRDERRFYPAEEHHQKYLVKYPGGYDNHSLRDFTFDEAPVERGWVPGKFKKPTDSELEERLSKVQYRVTQREGTEPPYQNEYWDNHREGIYVDVVSGEPLFSSLDKYDSGTGWPSFTRPLDDANLVKREDRALLAKRIEVRSKHADSHLGHVFDDGPAPTGQRYCMNSASLRFIPVEQLEAQGYGKYRDRFAKRTGAPAAEVRRR